jgi:bacillolysin
MSLFTKATATRSLFLLGALCSAMGLNAQQANADRSVLSMERNKVDGTPSIIQFSADAHWKAGQEQEIFSKYLGVDGVNTHMVRTYRTTTKANVTTSRYYEYYKGVKFEYGSFTVTEKDGLIHFASGNYYNTSGNPSATPTVAESVAFNKALQFVGASRYMWDDPKMEALIQSRYHRADTSYKPHGILTWVEDYSNGTGDRKMHLAWSFDIYAQLPVSRQKVFVDATDGHILHSNSMIKHTAATGWSKYSRNIPIVTAHVGSTYYLYDSTRGNGVHTLNMNNGTNYASATEFTSTANTWPVIAVDSPALDAHWGGEKVYDYWLSQQGRHSWDDLDGILLQYVHYDVNFDNAYWDGTAMTYGDGSGVASGGFSPLTCLDVTAHEIGHGVCEATANLVYASESGAMNEGLSDCWGATIENFANPFEVDAVAKQPWKIGEEIGGGSPLRSMDFPHNESNPDTYGNNDPFWVNVSGCTPTGGNDQCGVHTNSGVTNKWYYLVVMGGTGTNANGNSYNVNAIGWTSGARILYQTELALGSNATYADFRTTSIAVATTLFGACSAEVQCVTNAWYAVGVGAAFVPCTPQLGFTATTINTTEYVATTTCPASRTMNIGIKPTGTLITGGNPIVNVVAAPYSTAVAGVDYSISGGTMTFIAGDTSTHYATLTVYDNGAINDTKTLVLGFTLNAMGSTATISPLGDSVHITINNNDSAVLLGGPEYHTLNTGTAVTCNLTSAFPGTNKRSRTQWILTAAEMAAAGVRPGVPITQIGFYITSKSSTTAGFTGYAINMANTTASDVGTAFVTAGLVNVFPATTVVTNTGLDTLSFTNNFTWDGTSNVMVQVCYGANAGAYGGNDQMMGIQGGSNICAHNQSGTGTTTGCTLTWSGSGSNLSNARPVMRFKQIVPPSKIATVLGNTRTWNVRSATEVPFYNPSDTALIATVKNPTADLGCTSATLTGAGTGFTLAAFSATTNRSRKEVTINPTTNGSAVTYDATIYLTNTELAGATPSTLYMVKTEQPTDATITGANSTLLTPTLVTGTNFVGFKGTFTVMNNTRIFITDGPLCVTPATTITASGPTTFCAGGSVTLSAPVATGVTYQWQSGTTNIPGATSSSYTTGAAGNYRVIVTSGSCSGTSTATTVTVNTVGAGTISAAGGTTVCTGQSIIFTDATGGGTWSTNDATIATVDAGGAVTGIGAGNTTITYTVTNPCGTAYATQVVTVNASPVVATTTGTAIVCAGSTTALDNTTPSGAWSSASPGVATVSATGVVGGGSAGTTLISYTVSNAAGCVTSATTMVTVNAVPVATITASGPTTFCPTGSVTLSAPTGSGLSYQWQSGGADIPGATNSTYFTNTGADYTVVITNANNCSATSAVTTVTIDVSATVTPAVSIAAAPGLVLCSVPTTITFTPTPTNGGTSPTYSWNVNGTNMGSGTSFSYVPANGDHVQCVLTSNAVCRASDTGSSTVTVSIAPPSHPMVGINAIPNDTICAGVMATFAALPSFGGSTPAYVWNKNGSNVATGPAYNYVPANGDILKVTMTSNYSCRDQDTAVSAPMTLTVQTSVPNTVTVTSDHGTSIPSTGAVTFTATAANGGTSPTYQWYVNGVAVSGATNATYTTSSLGEGDVVTCGVVSSEACASPSTGYSTGLVMHWPAGITNATTGNQLMLIPNPNNGTFTIKGRLVTSDETITIQVTNMLGQEVFLTNAVVSNNTIDRTIALQQSLASGAYLVNVTTSTGKQVFHMVVNK